ncbi:MAG: Pyruvate synthase subunit PorC [Candidatus Methanophagaceae archaeon]|nr:MAG: Pyruvate synthase subunit PorC [Methanophagales archaeon]KAF5436366.1 pyruvate ferredoxin oxidoreductase gamma subunit [Methanophagales archaeon]
MYRVRFHGRGGQGARVASKVLGTAAFLDGYYAQDFPLYGAERRGAPVAASTRISEDPIMERGVIPEPDIVIVMDETLLQDPLTKPVSGIKPGGIVLINTTHSPAEAKAEYKITAQVLTLDITKIGLDLLGMPLLSTLAGGVAARIVGLSEESLTDAVKKVLAEIITDRKLLDKNVAAALYCFNAITPAKIELELKTTETIKKKSAVISLPFEHAEVSSPAINATGNTPLRMTGNWRVFRPAWNYDTCTRCMICVARCPDGCILVNEDGFPYTDYDNCKGCLICVEECPTKTLGKVMEVHAKKAIGK